MAHTVIDNKFYVDTAFLNALGGIPGVELAHMGFGEFYATTPHGTVDFDRMRGKDFPGQSGRSHRAYDREGYGTKATEWLIDQVESRGKSVRVASSDDSALRGRLIRLAHSRPDLRPHLLPLVGKTAGWTKGVYDQSEVADVLRPVMTAAANANRMLSQMREENQKMLRTYSMAGMEYREEQQAARETTKMLDDAMRKLAAITDLS